MCYLSYDVPYLGPQGGKPGRPTQAVRHTKQNVFKFKIAPHKQKSIVIFFLAGRWASNDHKYVPLVANTSRSFLHSWIRTIIGFLTRLTRRVSLLEQEQLTFPEHTSSPPVFSGACVTQSLVLCVCFLDHCLSFCPFLPLCCLSFDLRILINY